MAKKSMIARENKRTKLVGKFEAKRRSLKAIIIDPEASFEDKEAQVLSCKNFQETRVLVGSVTVVSLQVVHMVFTVNSVLAVIC